MKNRWIAAISVFCLSISVCSTALADNTKVVTLGTDLTEAQKDKMYEYFGVSKDQVVTIEVNNQDERKYLEGAASEETIGTRTYSCAYVEPTTKGGIQVKTANLTWVTSNMIASTLSTSGVENCNVVAACPIEVSGTGALTGIMMAYEQASDEELDEEKKQLASDELVYSTELGDSIGQDEAVLLINGVKTEVLKQEIEGVQQIEGVISEVANENQITLTEEQTAQLTSLMSRLAEMDYNYDDVKDTLERVETNVKDAIEKITGSASEETKNFFAGLWEKIKSFFTDLFQKGADSAESILNSTNDEALGDGVVSDSTLEE